MQQDVLGAEFERHRRRLVGVAYRMLGTLTDAEDVVQDAWLRLARSDRAEIVDLAAWLTTVTSRLCLDRLRSARAVRESYVGPWLPEPLVSLVEPAAGPAELVEDDESVRLALLVLLERLSPEQRVAFVLHDVFDVPFVEVAHALGTTAPAARQLASRARRAVRATEPEEVPRAVQVAVVDAFVRAASGGDLDELIRALAPDVVLTSDGGGRTRAALRPIHGADKVARFLLGLPSYYPGAAVAVRPAMVNGEVGLVIHVHPGPETPTEVSVIVPHVGPDRLVHGIDVMRNPDKLRHLRASS